MQVNADIRYPADPGRVFAMFLDPAFHEARCTGAGSVSHEVHVEPTAEGGCRARSRRVMPTDQVPPALQRFVSRGLTLVETYSWGPAAADGSRDGEVVVEVEGVPVRFTGVLRLVPDGAGSHETLRGDLRAAVPLFASKIEQAAEPAVTGAVRVEQRTGERYLTAG